MKIYIGADHGGFKLKEELKGYLGELGFEIEDVGATELNPEDDYPDFVIPVALRLASVRLRSLQALAQGKPTREQAFGIVIGRSGNGEAIAANKVKGARAALCRTVEDARLAKEKNDANVLSLGADSTDLEAAKTIVKTFLETPFSDNARHARRIKKITDYEDKSS
ncbi:RpiB/LacA/LacB family sugar-phosphate isomerase [Candidatus Microgenomates bacterium]|nr:RpiB/LacA/LacB family sugar-phosphate isomerase [Candidatus Microgenomates bacterium]